MKIILDDNKYKNLNFGCALAGIHTTSIEITWDEMDDYISQNGVDRLLGYINFVLRCRLLPGGALHISAMAKI